MGYQLGCRSKFGMDRRFRTSSLCFPRDRFALSASVDLSMAAAAGPTSSQAPLFVVDPWRAHSGRGIQRRKGAETRGETRTSA